MYSVSLQKAVKALCALVLRKDKMSSLNIRSTSWDMTAVGFCCFQFYFATLSAFSGQIVFERWCIGLYNVVCTMVVDFS